MRTVVSNIAFGSQSGDHLHLEYRVRDTSALVGWRTIDPHLAPRDASCA
jgi:hypothetical protein